MKKKIFLLYFFVALTMLMGCDKNTTQVTIEDGYTKTLVEVPQGCRVKDVLEEAELIISDKDVVEPSLESVIDEKNSAILIQRYAQVEVVTEEAVWKVELTGKTVEDAIANAGVKLQKNDHVNHSLQAYLVDGMTVSVAHRLEISLKVDGRNEKLLTQANTVEEFLAEQDIVLAEMDRVSPALNGKLTDGASVVVKRVEVKEITEVEPIMFATEVRYSNSMMKGTSKITTAGVNGEKKVTYRVTYVDGQEESREIVTEIVLKDAINQVVVKGSKTNGKTVVSKEKVYDCNGSGHGYYIITYSDGSVEYVDF